MEKKRMYAKDDDLISQLSQPILHHILSFLLAHDAARMATLSKTWLQVWKTLPFLDFGGRLSKHNLDMTGVLLHYVDQILSERRSNQSTSSIFKFSIGWGCSREIASYIERWVVILKDLHIRHLCLLNHTNTGVKDYITLPETILSAKSILSLDLVGFKLDSIRHNMLIFPSLQKLHLSCVHLSDGLIHNIVTNCRGIEDLQFEFCSGFKDVTIVFLVKLRNFKISIDNQSVDGCPKVVIKVPNLKSCIYEISPLKKDRMVPVDIHNLFNITGCVKLTTLNFAGKLGLNQDWFDKLFSSFPLLESLTFEDCIISAMKISSCKLKYLILRNCSELVQVNIDTPNLSTFIYWGTGAFFMSLNASPLLQVTVNLTQAISTDLVECSKVVKFLRVFGRFKFVTLNCFYCHHLAISKNIKKKQSLDQLPESGLNNLSISIWAGSYHGSLIREDTEVLDGLFWVYPQLESLSILSGRYFLTIFLQKLNERLTEQDSPRCCNSPPTKCWLHFLKEVTLETAAKDEAQWTLYRRSLRFSCEPAILRIKLKPREQ